MKYLASVLMITSCRLRLLVPGAEFEMQQDQDRFNDKHFNSETRMYLKANQIELELEVSLIVDFIS